jgi:hypothetical protein
VVLEVPVEIAGFKGDIVVTDDPQSEYGSQHSVM